MTDAQYADEVLPRYTPAQAKILLHAQDQAAGENIFYLNANKTDYLLFKLKGDTSTLIGKPLILIDKFTYLGCNILSTENCCIL